MILWSFTWSLIWSFTWVIFGYNLNFYLFCFLEGNPIWSVFFFHLGVWVIWSELDLFCLPGKVHIPEWEQFTSKILWNTSKARCCIDVPLTIQTGTVLKFDILITFHLQTLRWVHRSGYILIGIYIYIHIVPNPDSTHGLKRARICTYCAVKYTTCFTTHCYRQGLVHWAPLFLQPVDNFHRTRLFTGSNQNSSHSQLCC